MSNNISLVRGATYPSTYQHTDGAGNKLPLTGCTVYFTVKADEFDDSADDSSAVFKVVITSHDDAPNGFTKWDTLIPTLTEPGTYYYDIVVKDATGKEAPPVVFGECEIGGKVTNQ